MPARAGTAHDRLYGADPHRSAVVSFDRYPPAVTTPARCEAPIEGVVRVVARNEGYRGAALASPATVRALVLAALVMAACGPAATPPAAATSAGPAPSGSPAAKAIWPLRGTDAPSADAIARRPIVVRVPNDPSARPQSGLAQADLIFEMPVEGGLTRYAVVFHSQEADKVGPIRSARLSDLQTTPMLRGILAHVGAQTQTLERIRDAAKKGEFVDVDQFTHADAFDRVNDRPAPQNVYTSTKRIRDAAKDSANVQVPAFAFGDPPSGGKDPGTFTVPYTGDTRVTYEAASGGFKRTQGGRASDAAPVNVVVMKTDVKDVPGYVEDELGSLSLEIRTTGDGQVVVLRDGKRYDGKWSRSGNDQFRFVDASGAEIKLRPGLTWIHVVPISFDLGAG